jgi:integrase/recombinase XerD
MVPQTRRFDHWLQGFYLAKAAEGISKNTLIEYTKDFRHFSLWLGDRDVTALTPSDLKVFLAGLRLVNHVSSRPLSPKTIYNTWVALRSLYRFLEEESALPDGNPMKSVPAPKAQTSVILPLGEEEVKTILVACDRKPPAAAKDGRRVYSAKRLTSARDRAIVLFLLDSGVRASELCDLQLADVDQATGRVIVRSGKGGKGRVTYLGKHCRRALWRYLNRESRTPADPLFLSVEGRPLTPNSLDHVFRGLEKRSGVQNLHPHRLRHTFATQFLRNGGNLLALQRLLGHTSLQMVKRYAEVAEADLQTLHETGSPVDRWRL